MPHLLQDPSALAAWKREALGRVSWRLSRRELLGAAAAGAAALAGFSLGARRSSAAEAPGPMHGPVPAAPPPADADGPKTVVTGTFYFPRLLFHVRDETGDQWNIYPVADVILRRRLRQLTNVNVSQDPVVVRLADLDNTCRYPFVFATSEGYFDLPDIEKKNLKEFLLRGGFVLADDCVLGKTGDRFFRDYTRIVNQLFQSEGLAMTRVPNDHEIFHCYFDFPDGAPFIQGVNHGAHGLFEKDTGRIMTFLTPGDIHCGWTCMWAPRDLCEACLRMGINIIVYYLTH